METLVCKNITQPHNGRSGSELEITPQYYQTVSFVTINGASQLMDTAVKTLATALSRQTPDAVILPVWVAGGTPLAGGPLRKPVARTGGRQRQSERPRHLSSAASVAAPFPSPHTTHEQNTQLQAPLLSQPSLSACAVRHVRERQTRMRM